MKRADGSMILGLALASLGGLLLLQNLGVLESARDILWTLVFAACGAAFLSVFVKDRAHWWAAIPGFTLLALGALIGLTALVPGFGTTWGGGLFLGGIGLGFWAVYLTDRAHWWAMIPGGVLFTLAVVAGLSDTMPGLETGGIFFLGLALTFGLVYLLPTTEGRMGWAIYPAAVLLVMALLIMTAMEQVLAFLWPAALILAGLYLAYRTLRLQHNQRDGGGKETRGI